MPLTMRYRAARELVRNVGAIAHELFEARQSQLSGHTDRAGFALRSIGTLGSRLRDKLAAAFPRDFLIDDERHRAGLESRPSYWIIDPVCGATNFVRGIPLYAISASFVADGSCQLAAIYDPERDQLFHARRGDGAYCEHAGVETPLRASPCTKLDGAVIGLDEDGDSRNPEYLSIRHELMERGVLVRDLGATALELAYVAAGRCDGYVGLHADPRLLLGGLLLVEEAGGARHLPAATDFDHPFGPSLGCSRGILASLKDVVQPTDSRRSPGRPAMTEWRAH